MKPLVPLRALSPLRYKAGDVIVLIGEVAADGYLTGLVEQAKQLGMRIIGSTVGRRDPQGKLRPLSQEELQSFPFPCINVPLECGFDLDPSSTGQRPIDQIESITLQNWNKIEIDWKPIAISQSQAKLRFQNSLAQFSKELESMIPDGANVIFVHAMAGGVLRSPSLSPILFSVLRGQGESFISTSSFLESPVGRLCALNFNEVTAESYQSLIDATTDLRRSLEKQNRRVSYVAYGYHGTEVFLKNQYRWASPMSYFQFYAKLKLEEISRNVSSHGIRSTVYNAPEVTTKSSAVLYGLELSIHLFVAALERELGPAKSSQYLVPCIELLKNESQLADLVSISEQYYSSEIIQPFMDFERWSANSSLQVMEFMLTQVSKTQALHKNPQHLVKKVLSRNLIMATAQAILCEAWNSEQPVLWLGHDVLTQALR